VAHGLLFLRPARNRPWRWCFPLSARTNARPSLKSVRSAASPPAACARTGSRPVEMEAPPPEAGDSPSLRNHPRHLSHAHPVVLMLVFVGANFVPSPFYLDADVPRRKIWLKLTLAGLLDRLHSTRQRNWLPRRGALADVTFPQISRRPHRRPAAGLTIGSVFVFFTA